MTKFTARRLGSRCRVTARSAVSGSISRSLLDGERVGQPAPLVVGAHPHADVGVAALVAAAGAGDAAERDALGVARTAGVRAARTVRPARAPCVSVAAAMSVRVPSACTATCGTSVGVDVAGGEHAVHLAVARRRGGGEARIAGQRQFDCGRGELAPDVGGVGVAHHAVQQRAGGLLGVGVGVVGAGQRPLQLGGLDGQAGLQLPPHQLGLGLDVEAGQHERHRVAEAADAVERHLQRRRRRLAAHAARCAPGRRRRRDSSMLSIRSVTSGFA